MEKKQEVVNKIIEILEQTDISQGYPNLYQRIEEWIDEIPTEKVHDGDLVSRRDAIEAINALPRWVIDNNGEFQPVDAQTESMIDPEDAVSAIENLPSAQKKGYTKADYIMALHKEYGCSLARAEEAHQKALEYLRNTSMMKG